VNTKGVPRRVHASNKHRFAFAIARCTGLIEAQSGLR
jgi:hypothetical protein